MEFFNKLQENKPVFYTVIAVIAAVLMLMIVLPITIHASSNNSLKKGETDVSNEPIKDDIDLLTTDNLGKALEIQALLAKQDIAASRAMDGTKSRIYLKKGDCTTGRKRCTTEQRDKAIIAIVESGLYDQNVGLEIFDKGDFTSTKDDKAIRLARAINGELSRLIRKIKPIENASVFISIPEKSMFTSNQKPVTATVQVTLPVGEKLEQTKVKAITNLLLGSVYNLAPENIAITDTNGNVYHSLIGAHDEMLQRLEENDRYMQKKVAAQLDRLLNGKGNYVVTVSTFLVQAPIEKFSIIYDPTQKAAVTEQSFQEGLGDQTSDSNKGINAVSVYLPNGLAPGDINSTQNRSYSRQARETQYGVTKTQVNEYIKPGVVEEISIAVTIEKSAMPTNITTEELKDLIARAASPKASAKNVSIAYSDSLDPYLASDRPVKLAEPDKTGNPWWLTLAIAGLVAIFIIIHVSNKIRKAREEQQQEVEQLRQLASQQEQQLQAINARAQQLTNRQSELAQGLLEQQQRGVIAQNQADADVQAVNQLVEALIGVSSDISDLSEEDVSDKIKSWIEKN